MVDTETIIQRVSESYRRCSSYQDIGLTSVGLPFFHTKEFRFQTCFVRPSHLYIEWQGFRDEKPVHGKNGLWFNGEHTRLKLTHRGESQTTACPSLSWALSAVRGGTLGSEAIVYLLLPSIHLGSPLWDLDALSYLSDDNLGDTTCYVLADIDRRSIERKFWICRENYSILKIECEWHKNPQQEDKELKEREIRLAALLDREAKRPAPEPTEHGDVRHVVETSYRQVEFNARFEMSIFDLPDEGPPTAQT